MKRVSGFYRVKVFGNKSEFVGKWSNVYKRWKIHGIWFSPNLIEKVYDNRLSYEEIEK